MSSPTVIFVRHGETDWNIDGRLQGQRDIPLNAKGREQAQRNGFTVAEKVPEAVGFDFVASPLIRARETMEIVRRDLGLDPSGYRVDDRLREIAYGDWEGLTLDELEKTSPEQIAAREKDKWSFVPPSGESYAMLARRVEDWLASVVTSTLVAAHGGVGRILLTQWAHVEPAEAITLIFPQDKVMLWRDEVLTWL